MLSAMEKKKNIYIYIYIYTFVYKKFTLFSDIVWCTDI